MERIISSVEGCTPLFGAGIGYSV